MTQDTLSEGKPRSFSCAPHAFRLGRTIRLMDGETPVASGRIVGLLEAPTIGKVTLLLRGFEPETGGTRELSVRAVGVAERRPGALGRGDAILNRRRGAAPCRGLATAAAPERCGSCRLPGRGRSAA